MTTKTRICALALVTLLTALGLEGAFRVWLWATAQPITPSAIRADLHRSASKITEKIPTLEGERPPAATNKNGATTADFLHPYAAFEKEHGLETVTRMVEYYASPRSDEVFDVLVLGGSVAGRFAGGRAEFMATLLADPRIEHLDLVSHARGAYKQPQQVALLAYLFSMGYRPDAVINIDGFNEVAIGLSNARRGVNPNYPDVGPWARMASGTALGPEILDLTAEMRMHQMYALQIKEYGGTKLAWSAITGTLLRTAMEKACSGFAWKSERYDKIASGGWLKLAGVRGPEFDTAEPAEFASIIRAWEEGSRSIDAMCRARGIHYLHVLQPTLHDPGAKIVSDEEKRTGVASRAWLHGVERGYPLLREGCARLSEAGVHVADLSMLFKDVEETIYFDSCHFAGTGLSMFGEAIAESLLADLDS